LAHRILVELVSAIALLGVCASQTALSQTPTDPHMVKATRLLDEGLQAIVEWHRAHVRGAAMREVSLAQIAAYEAAARRRAEAPV